MAILPADYLTNVTTKGYENGKLDEEIAQERNNRLKGYRSICLSGLATLYWGGAASMLTKTHETHPNVAYLGFIYSAVVLFLNLVGVAAASFPSTTPWALGIAGFASWQAMLSALATLHLSTFNIHPKPLHCIISMIVCCFIVSTYWGICAQYPVALHVVAKYIVWGVCKHCLGPLSCLAKPFNGVDFSPVASAYHTARGYMEATPGFLPASFMADITVKGYLKQKKEEEREKEEDSRLNVYLSMCLSGVTTLYWSGAATILLDLNKTNSTVAYSFLLCSISSLAVMLLAITAATFPSTAPGKMEFAGLGAWQAMIFVITSFHLATFKLHPGPVFFWISMMGSLILFSIFWGISSQDPMFVHVTAKLAVWVFCLIAYALYLFGCKIAREGRDRFFAANDGGNGRGLHGPLLGPQVPQHNHNL